MNGANAVIQDPYENTLVVLHNYGSRLWGLPGGGIEAEEEPVDAVIRETREETDLELDKNQLTLIAICTRRNKESVNLYKTFNFKGNLAINLPGEISDARFMSFEEIFCLHKKDKFGTGYLRMIIMHMMCLQGLDTPVVERYLYEPIVFDAGALGVLTI
ncbi:MAG: NUDIX hydrolase [Candidatus Zambryskibacteria bacterium]|nr:NUDIX hydrolase [Candidatus Zambryskibacteria bacterium]